MTETVTSPYDVAKHLRTPQEMVSCLEAGIEEADGDAAFIARALGDIARARGMSQVACDDGLSRESLYKFGASCSAVQFTPAIRRAAVSNSTPVLESMIASPTAANCSGSEIPASSADRRSPGPAPNRRDA